MDASINSLKERLEELGTEIDAQIEEFNKQSALHGPARKAAADWKLQHLELLNKAKSGGRPTSEIGRDVDALKLSFERWVARIDEGHRT